MNSREAVSRALACNDISLPGPQLDQICAYMEYLLEWNTRINLISRASLENTASHHIVDSVLAARMLPPVTRITDLGTGGGLPGIIISILAEKTEVILCDTKAKKINFLNNCIRDLNLPHTRVHDAANNPPERKSEIVVCRAFAALDKILREGKKYLQPGGRIFAFKGRMETVHEELKALPKKIKYETTVYSLKTVAETHERTLVSIRPTIP